MRFYKVSYWSPDTTGHMGFDWFTTKRKADREARSFLRAFASDPNAEAAVEVVEVVPNKRGILRALRVYATHPDNG